MAQDFRAIITGEANLNKAKQDFISFKQQLENTPIKLKFDTGGIKLDFSNLQRQAQQQGAQIAQSCVQSIEKNIKNVKVGSKATDSLFYGMANGLTISGGSIMNVLGADTKLATALRKELKLINEEGAQLQKISIAENGKSFEATVKNANTLVQVLGRLNEETDDNGNVISQSWSTSQKYITDYTNAIKQAQQEAQKLATEVDKVTQSFVTGQFDANIAKMEQGLTNISNSVGSDLVKKASDAAAEYYRITQEITNSLNGTATAPLQGQQLADAYKEAELYLKSYNNAMIEVRANTQQLLAEGVGARYANQVETWAQKNSKALKQYGDQIDILANKMRNAKTQGELNDLINQFKNLKAEAGSLGLTGLSFADQFKRAFVHIGEFTGIYAVTKQIRQLPREMAQEVIKIDTAMTELRKVSTATASELNDYFDSAADSAYKYGQAINEVIDSTASWTRLGYNLADASTLTNVTAELAQVGSGLDTKSATEGLQATIRGFGLVADEAKHVGDLINEVADTQPIDALGIINGLERSSAVMRETNNTLEETVGLITATTSVTQDATTAGTAWRTVALRITGAKQELEDAGLETEGMVESTAKLRDNLLAVAGIDILESDGKTFKSTYKIMEELAKVWNQLSDLDKAGILDKIAGKRGAVAVSSALQNWNIAESAKQTALNSEGSMDRQLEIYNQSIQASINKFKVAFQELSADIINSDFLKGVIDAGTTIVKIIDELVKHIGVLGTAITALGMAKIVSTAINGAKTVDGLGSAFITLFKLVSGGDVQLTSLSKSLTTITSAANGAGTAVASLGSSLASFLISPAGIIAAATAIGVAIYKIKNAQEEALNKQASDASDAWNTSKGDVSDYIEQYKALKEKLDDANTTESERIGIKQQLFDLQNEINGKYGEQLEGLDLVNGRLETQLNILRGISKESAQRNIQDNYDAYNAAKQAMTKTRNYTIGGGSYSVGGRAQLSAGVQRQYDEIFESVLDKNGNKLFAKMSSGEFKFTGDTSEFDDAVHDVLSGLEELQSAASDSDKAILQSSITSARKALEKNKEVLDKYQENYKSYLEQSLFAEGFGDELTAYAKRVQEYNDALIGGDMGEVLSKRNEMLDYYNNNISNILNNHDEYKEFFENVSAQIDEASQKLFDWKDIVADGTAEANNNFAQSADTIKSTIDTIKKMGFDGVDIQAILGNPNDVDYSKLSELAKLWNPDIDLKKDDDRKLFADFLEQLGATSKDTGDEIDLTTAKFEDFMKMASNSIDTIDKVNSALVNSFASGGLSAKIDKDTGELTGDVAEIIKAYQGLKGFDVGNIFERTAKGVIVNRDALRELQKTQEDALKEEFGNRMAEAWHNWQEAISNKNYDKADYWKRQYENVNLLASAYDGATSAYQKWLDAQKMGEAGDMYDTVAKTALDRGKELYDKGLVGTNEFRAIAQLYSDMDLTKASVDEVTKAYENGYSVVKKYFTEGQEGAVAFADKIVDLGYATKDAEGNYDFYNGIDTEALAHDLGISVDLVEAAFNKLGDYGFNIHFNFDDGQSALMQFEQRLREISSNPTTANVDVEIQNDEQLREIAEYLLSIDDEKIRAEFDITGEDDVDSLIEKLTKKYNVQATLSTDSSAVQTPQSTVIDAALQINQRDLQLDAQTVKVEPEPNPLEVQTVAKVDSTEVDNYEHGLKDIDRNQIFHADHGEVDSYVASIGDINRSVNYGVSVYGTRALDALPKDGSTRDIYVNVHTNQLYTGTVSKSAFQGMSHANGTVSGKSHANGLLGKVGLKSNENALINELGAEMIVRPSEDAWMIFNDGKPTFAALKKGDVKIHCIHVQRCA